MLSEKVTMTKLYKANVYNRLHYCSKYLVNKMIFYALSIFNIVISVLCRAEQFTIPVITCKRNSTDYSTCLTASLQETWPRIVEGIPEFDIPRLDPFYYKDGKVAFNANEIYGEGFITNATLYGFKNFHFLDMRPHFLNDIFRLEVDMIMPKIIIESNVGGNANLLGIQTHGAGQFNLTLNDNKITWDVTGYVKNDTWIVEHFQFILAIGSLRTQLSGFFDGIKELNDVLEDFINEFWPPIYRVIGSEVLQQIGDPFLTNLTNHFFSKVSFSKIFP